MSKLCGNGLKRKLKKMRESYIEIDHNRLIYNLQVIKRQLQHNTQILANLKANAYGLGAYEIGRVLEQENIAYFSVAYINEGVFLRQKGITTNLLVFNPSFETFDALVDFHLEPEVSSLTYLKALSQYLKSKNLQHFPIHLKLDTGMHRAGIRPEEMNALIELLKNNKSVSVKSVFSHLAAAEDPREDNFTLQQIQTFESLSKKLSEKLPESFFRHLLNTAGVFRFPQAQYDMVRPGLGLFGYNMIDGQEKKLLPVARLKTKINQIKNLESGDTVGYNRRFKSTGNNRVGLLPLGYADGVDRRLGYETFYVKCRGHKIPVIGTISMDTMSIDLTNTPCQQGDEVIVFDHDHSLYDIAKQLETIPYEIIAGLTRRLKRVMI